MEEVLEGYQIFWSRCIRVSTILAKLQNSKWAVKVLECIPAQMKITYFITKVASVTAYQTFPKKAFKKSILF